MVKKIRKMTLRGLIKDFPDFVEVKIDNLELGKSIKVQDINLPGISGLEALKMLRADAATARTPVLALSANAIPDDIARGLASGFFQYLTKPIKVPEFMLALDAACRSARTASPAAQTQ